ncbi:MAG TPA: metallopeptidase TldD-related protein [Bryobacteraceae bacterium]|nr:metallopeptidase TldD-related protein [Bryobacteraceae bacterium]
MRRVAAFCLLLSGFCLLPAAGAAQDADVLLKAMKDELARSRELVSLGLKEPPYFIEYRVEDTVSSGVAATLGALVETRQDAYRIPTVRVRAGNYTFDSTNHIYSQVYLGSRYDPERLPLDNDYLALRRAFWLATDRAFKTAEDAIARKRSSLKNMSLPDALPDFSKAQPNQAILPFPHRDVSIGPWKDRIVKLSSVFAGYPLVLTSGVELTQSQSMNYVLNSEGTVLRTPEDVSYIRMVARGLAADGSDVHDARVYQAFEASQLPSEDDLMQDAKEVGERLTALAQAPRGEAYDGPMLFEAAAAAQLFGQMLGDELKVTRKPIADPGRTVPYVPSELENRIGSRILPDWMSVVDDPTQTAWHGQTLLGHYLYDMEGVAAQPVTLIDKGILKNFLLTRTPVYKDYPGSNGHARLPGSYGARAPGFGNLFVRSSEAKPAADMKKLLIQMCRDRNKPYGILIRRLDYPSSASIPELRRLIQASGSDHPVAPPLLAYKVYPDGREELVRGVRFRDVSTRSLKDIAAADDETYVFNLIDSDAPFALMGAGSFITTASVIAPALLFDELELEPVQEEVPKPPIVPAPPLTGLPVPSQSQKAVGD